MGALYDDYLTRCRLGQRASALDDCFPRYPKSLWDTTPVTGPCPLLSRTAPSSMIVTGQQPGIFIGPVYTIYKAVTAICLAWELEKQHGIPCTPVFWLASEDHDFEEAAAATFLTRELEPHQVVYQPASDITDLPMHEVPVEKPLHNMVREVRQLVPGGPHAEAVEALLLDTLGQASSLADWSARLLGALFKDTPLVIFTPESPEARRLAMPVLKREIETPLASTRLINQAAARLQELGYDPQLERPDDACNFFLYTKKKRRRVVWQNNTFVVPEEHQSFTQQKLLTLLEHEPERFSPNVALRCVVQQALFPAAAYVAGPGEIAYWAQLRGVFDHFGYAMPVVYPRARALLLDAKTAQWRDRYDVDALAGEDAAFENALKQNPFEGVPGDFEKAAEHLRHASETLHATLDDTHPADAMADALNRNIDAYLERIERALLLADTERAEVLRKRIRRVCNVVAPHRKPQERVYSPFSFLFQHGPQLIDRLFDELDIKSFNMNEVAL